MDNPSGVFLYIYARSRSIINNKNDKIYIAPIIKQITLPRRALQG